MSAAACLAVLIATFGDAPHVACVRGGGSGPYEVVQAVIDSEGEVEPKFVFQSSLLNSSHKIQRAYAQISQFFPHDAIDESSTPTCVNLFESNKQENSAPSVQVQEGKKKLENKPQVLFGSGGEKKYTYLEYLQEGGFGAVYSLTDDAHHPNPIAAVKVAHKTGASDSLCAEAQNMALCAGSPHVVDLLDKFHDKGGRHYIVMEYMKDGDLIDLIGTEEWEKNPNLTVVGPMFYDLLRGLAFIHGKGISHLDIKPDNVMLSMDTRLRAKLTDFGLSKETTKFNQMKSQQFGTHKYWAPEIWEGKAEGPAADVFALGVALYMMVTGGDEPFWCQLSRRKIVNGELAGRKIVNGLHEIVGKYYPIDRHEEALKYAHVPREIQDVIACMLRVQKDRCTIQKIMQMPWMVQVREEEDTKQREAAEKAADEFVRAQDRGNTYTAVLDQSQGTSHGITFDPKTLVVQNTGNGLVPSWNMAHEDKKIMIGHSMLQVNDIRDNANLMLKECKKYGKLTIVFQVREPRDFTPVIEVASEKDTLGFTLSDSPLPDVHVKSSYKVGIETGDKLVSVNGIPVTGMTKADLAYFMEDSEDFRTTQRPLVFAFVRADSDA